METFLIARNIRKGLKSRLLPTRTCKFTKKRRSQKSMSLWTSNSEAASHKTTDRTNNK